MQMLKKQHIISSTIVTLNSQRWTMNVFTIRTKVQSPWLTATRIMQMFCFTLFICLHFRYFSVFTLFMWLCLLWIVVFFVSLIAAVLSDLVLFSVKFCFAARAFSSTLLCLFVCMRVSDLTLLCCLLCIFRWIPFAMLSVRQEDTVMASQPTRCTVRRASV